MLPRLLLVAAIAVAAPFGGAAVWAEPAATAVSIASGTLARAQQALATVTAERGQLEERYAAQLAAIDKLMKQRASWRRDREVASAKADSADTADRLTKIGTTVAEAQRAVDRARVEVNAEIDAELAAEPTPARAAELAQLRAKVAPPAAPKKIVLPHTDIDPLADPEELDQQATALRTGEAQLAAQVAGLDGQVHELERVDEVRKQHLRAVELGTRDDEQPHRTVQKAGGTTTDNPSLGIGTGGGSGSGAGGTGPNGATPDQFSSDRGAVTVALDNEAIVLGEVVDHATIDGLVRASRSSDPAARADAAKRARNAVADRLAKLKQQRAAIERRAAQLRGTH